MRHHSSGQISSYQRVIELRGLELSDAGRALVAARRRIVEVIAEVERTAAGQFRATGEPGLSGFTVTGRTHAFP